MYLALDAFSFNHFIFLLYLRGRKKTKMPTSVKETLHLVSRDGELEDTDVVSSYLQQVAEATGGSRELHSVGVGYHVVCIFGGQSSGKSTLLNHLFQTQFQELDASVRRGQTTQGAFLASAVSHSSDKPPPPLLLMDLEGADGLERGDNQCFERQLSLFGLSAADTLIINMWAVDVGRNNAANLSLLRTIFEMNLHLFLSSGYEKEEKPTLLVILRDFSGSHAEPVIETLRKSFDIIWEGIKKPEAYMDSNIEDIFHWRCFLLPHYELQRDQFDLKVKELREWFLNPESSNYLFAHAGMFRGIPLDGLPAYLSSCWDSIRSSKELDIPTQRELLAQHRCTELMEEEIAHFEEEKLSLMNRINDGEAVKDVSIFMKKVVENNLSSFKALARLYNDQVTEEFLKRLQTHLMLESRSLLQSYAKQIATEVVGASLEYHLQTLMDSAMIKLVAEGGSRPFTTPAEASADQTPVQMYCIEQASYVEAITSFWHSLCEGMEKLLSQVQSPGLLSTEYLGRFAEIVENDPVLQEYVSIGIANELVERLKSRCSSMAANGCDTLHRYFEWSLSHKSDSQIRVLRSAKALEKQALFSKQSSMFVLGALFYFRLHLQLLPQGDHNEEANVISFLSGCTPKIILRQNDEESRFFLKFTSLNQPPVFPAGFRMVHKADDTTGVHQDNILLPASAIRHAFQQFTERADATIHGKLAAIEAARMNVPAWVYLAVFLLSLNEIMYVLQTPLLLITIIIASVIFGRKFLIEQWEDFETTGPIWLVTPLRIGIDKMQSVVESLRNSGMVADHGEHSGGSSAVAAESGHNPSSANSKKKKQ